MSKKTDKMIADDIFEKYNNHPIRASESKKCSKYVAFYEGYHYGDVDGDRITAALAGEQVMHRSKLNFIQPYAHIAVSNLLKESPIPLGIPTGTDMKDTQAARVVTDLATNIFDQNERNILSDVWGGELNAYKCGAGYAHIFWDKEKYARVTKNGVSRMVGDWRTSIHDVFEVFPDPTASKFIDKKWIIYVYMADVDELRDVHRKFADRINEVSSDEIKSARYSDSAQQEQSSAEITRNRALVLEYWERPSIKHSDGRKITVINKTILVKEDDNPYADLGYLYSLPFVPFRWNSVPEKFRGLGGVKDQIPIQKEINFVASNIMKNIRATAGMKYLLPKGIGIKEQELASDRAVHYYNATAGVAPTVVGGTPQAGYVLQYLNFLISTQGDIAGIHDVSKAQIPERGSHMPAALYKMLQDTEAIRFSHNMRELQTSLKFLTMFILKLIRKHWNERRYLSVLGEDKGYAIKAFEKSQLEGSWDVTLKVGSAINNSPAAKIETGMNLMDREVLQAAEEGQEWAIKFLDFIEYGDMRPFNEKRKKQRIRAERFLETILKKGKVPDILMTFNEKIFMETLDLFTLTKEYEDLDDEKKDVIEEAIRLLNKNLIAKEQQKQPRQQSPQQPPMQPPMQPGAVQPVGAAMPMPMEGMPVEGMPPEQGGMMPGGM